MNKRLTQVLGSLIGLGRTYRSQKEFARKIGISPGYLSDIIKGSKYTKGKLKPVPPPPELIQFLFERHDINPEFITGDDPVMKFGKGRKPGYVHLRFRRELHRGLF